MLKRESTREFLKQKHTKNKIACKRYNLTFNTKEPFFFNKIWLHHKRLYILAVTNNKEKKAIGCEDIVFQFIFGCSCMDLYSTDEMLYISTYVIALLLMRMSVKEVKNIVFYLFFIL